MKVAVRWNSGRTSSCITGIDGRCTTSSSKLSKTRNPVAFASIESVTAEGLTYISAKDHTSDGDSAVSGLRVRVTRDQK